MKSKTRRFLKCTIGAELRKQLITSVRLRRGPCDDNRDFRPVARKAHSLKPIKLGIRVTTTKRTMSSSGRSCTRCP